CFCHVDACFCFHAVSPSLRPAPRSALFPYTTLFRSAERVARRDDDVLLLEDLERELLAVDVVLVAAEGVEGALGLDDIKSRHLLDRKSTRLNSSHLGISYAVFCLKKKNGEAQGRDRK